MPTFADFASLRIRVGTVTRAELNEGARASAYQLWIDVGDEELQSSAQVVERSSVTDLVGSQGVAVTGFTPLRVAGFRPDVLILGVETGHGVVLLGVDAPVDPGSAVS